MNQCSDPECPACKLRAEMERFKNSGVPVELVVGAVLAIVAETFADIATLNVFDDPEFISLQELEVPPTRH